MISQPSLCPTAELTALTESQFKSTQILHTSGSLVFPSGIMSIFLSQITPCAVRASHPSRCIKTLLSCWIVKWGNPERVHFQEEVRKMMLTECNFMLQVCCWFKRMGILWLCPSQSHKALIVQQSYKGGERYRTLLLPPAGVRPLFKKTTKNKPPKFPYLLLIPLHYSNTDMIKVCF